ncbi:MAG: type II toxin-antitoxin system Phd/YefM family antitoxin [Dehalococcoidia bacterium]|nr:type II toxin-antitoxin system Phd/YefM family antitoxin [Dehalococcoidia bacterium]
MNTQLFPQIRPLSDLRSSIGEIPAFVDNQQTPVIFTKHGRGKYVFISMEEYSELVSRRELYHLLDDGLDDIANGRTQEFSAAMKEISRKASDECVSN